MKESQAREKGFSFTGAYGRTKEEMKIKQKDRYKGYKTVIVPEKSDGYSRSAGDYKGRITGYSIYAERKYFIEENIKNLESRVASHKCQILYLVENQKIEVEKLIEGQKKEEENLKASKDELTLLNTK